MKAPLTIDDLLALQTVSDPQLSPDGQWVAYVVTRTDLERNLNDSDIHLVPAAGGAGFQLTRGPRRDDTPRWSPDGQWLAFISGRGESDQLYRIRPFGGEAEALTEEKSGVAAFAWSPDGRRLAFLSPDPADPAAQQRREREGDFTVVDAEPRRQHLHLLDPDTRAVRRLTRGPFHVTGCCWSADGRHLAFAHQPGPGAADLYRGGLSWVPAAGGRPRPLAAQRGNYTSLAWSPDGRWLAYLLGTGWLDQVQLGLCDAAGGQRRLAPRLEDLGSGASVAWAPDSRALYLPVGQGTATHLFRVGLSGRTEQLTRGEQVHGPLSVAAKRLAFLRQDGSHPAEVFTGDLRAAQVQRLTRQNPQLNSRWLAGKERVRWQSPDGTPVEGLLIKPAGYRPGRAVPLLVCVHGGPASVYTNTFNGAVGERYPHQVFAGAGYAVLLPNPRGSAHYGNRFRCANLRDWGGGDLEDILAGVDHLVDQGLADPRRLGILGWSYGGFMTGWAITRTHRFRAASFGAGLANLVSMYGQTDIPEFMETYWQAPPWEEPGLYLARSPVAHAGRIKTPTLIQHGDRDLRVPLPQGQELYQALKRRRVPVRFVVYPRQAHALTEPRLVRAVMAHNLAWFDQWLKGKPGGGGR